MRRRCAVVAVVEAQATERYKTTECGVSTAIAETAAPDAPLTSPTAAISAADGNSESTARLSRRRCGWGRVRGRSERAGLSGADQNKSAPQNFGLNRLNTAYQPLASCIVHHTRTNNKKRSHRISHIAYRNREMMDAQPKSSAPVRSRCIKRYESISIPPAHRTATSNERPPLLQHSFEVGSE